ncbi:hypothetical protein ACCAA_300063 [Candidatus Accumulibacter aalborgensis]|uniref:Uncharacterized protein n=1 Tax=Candidatus Accumulibacter aalborgensis TaxID=1860102 RepID=A0A1A8XM26_9PROT|nr:hypothetical protein ACCAA_300063 [Candidatus Accumulibacter aalborgensis]
MSRRGHRFPAPPMPRHRQCQPAPAAWSTPDRRRRRGLARPPRNDARCAGLAATFASHFGRRFLGEPRCAPLPEDNQQALVQSFQRARIKDGFDHGLDRARRAIRVPGCRMRREDESTRWPRNPSCSLWRWLSVRRRTKRRRKPDQIDRLGRRPSLCVSPHRLRLIGRPSLLLQPSGHDWCDRKRNRATGRMNVVTWQHNRYRWILVGARGCDEAAPESSLVDAENGLPGALRWAYVCGRDAKGELFARYRRSRHREAKYREASVAPARGRHDDPGYAANGWRSCPSCNGWVYRIQRGFLDGLMNIPSPVHRYRCRSAGCRWEGNLRVQRDF